MESTTTSLIAWIKTLMTLHDRDNSERAIGTCTVDTIDISMVEGSYLYGGGYREIGKGDCRRNGDISSQGGHWC